MKTPLGEAGPLVTLLALAVPMVGVATLVGRTASRSNAERMEAWRIEGPACPATTASLHQDPRRAPRVFTLGAHRFSRAGGDVSCAFLRDSHLGPEGELVCQFTRPVLLEIASVSGAQSFAPGVGQPATVRIRKDELRCVLAGRAGV
jgi:hypothetical protein